MRRSSWLTNAGDTVEDRMIDAPDGKAIKKNNNKVSIFTLMYTFCFRKVPATAPRSPYKTLSA